MDGAVSDDSANRRLSLGQSFLAADAIVDIMHNVANGFVVYPNVIKARIQSELPFMATETSHFHGSQGW